MHTMRYHAHYQTSGTGHLYQGRFKSFPIQVSAQHNHPLGGRGGPGGEILGFSMRAGPGAVGGPGRLARPVTQERCRVRAGAGLVPPAGD